MQRADAVFEGGGVKGIALVGALRAFEEDGFKWQNLAGTSAGGITAALLAVGYDAQELKRVMDERVEFRRFMDTRGVGKLPIAGPWLSLLFRKGMYEGDYFLGLMRQLIAEKTGKPRLAFGDLTLPREAGDSLEDYQTKYRYKLRLVASDISRNEMVILPQDVAGFGQDPDDLEVALAVRMTMSIPFFFKPVIMDEGNDPRKKHWIVDGGMLSNFPINLFDSPAGQTPAWPTLGFLLWEPGSEKPRNESIRGLVSLTRALVRTMSTAHDRKALKEADSRRIVKIPTGRFAATDFDLSDEDRDWLYQSGYAAARQFLHGPHPWKFEDYVAQRLQYGAQALENQ